jgi:acetyl-CoA C-acetyltransferase
VAEAYIIEAVRTPVGRRGGELSHVHPADLGAHVITALLNRVDVDPTDVDDVIFGCVDTVGPQAGDIARTSWLAAGFPEQVPGVTVDRQCGSSQQALHFAAQAVMSGTQDVVIAAGVESMTRVPMGMSVTLPQKSGFGFYVGRAMAARYPNVEFSQFTGAEMMARKYELSKEDLDVYALHSHRLAIAAAQSGVFDEEIVPVEVRRIGAGGVTSAPEIPGELHIADEGIRFDATLESIRNVKLIAEGGRVTAATASQICDGAAGVMIANERGLKRLGAKPLARIHHMSVMGDDPVIMLEAPLPATEAALRKSGLSIDDIDLFEVNEAFAPVPLAWLQATGADPQRLNVHGGAIALGHPLGASGAKLMTTLVYALKKRGKRYGLQTMCEGGGMANVTIIEAL